MKKIEENNTLVFIVDVRANKRQISQVKITRISISDSRPLAISIQRCCVFIFSCFGP